MAANSAASGGSFLFPHSLLKIFFILGSIQGNKREKELWYPMRRGRDLKREIEGGGVTWAGRRGDPRLLGRCIVKNELVNPINEEEDEKKPISK